MSLGKSVRWPRPGWHRSSGCLATLPCWQHSHTFLAQRCSLQKPHFAQAAWKCSPLYCPESPRKEGLGLSSQWFPST